jgi:hypothetical protein
MVRLSRRSESGNWDGRLSSSITKGTREARHTVVEKRTKLRTPQSTM